MAFPAPLRLAALAALAAALAAPPTTAPPAAVTSVSVAGGALVARTTDTFVGHGWEMWQMFNYLPAMRDDARLAEAARPLAGSVVRVGGITADWTFYADFAAGSGAAAVPAAPVAPAAQAQARPLADGFVVPRAGAADAPFWPSAPANLTRASFLTLLGFMNTTGLSLLFDLNELLGRNCSVTHQPCSWDCGDWCEGAWDMSNAREFLQWVHDERLVGFGPARASPLIGFELGNELVTHLDPQANADDVKALAALIGAIWADAPAPPPLFAPSTDACADPSAALIMDQTATLAAGFSFHAYPGGGGTGSNALASILLNATWLRDGIMAGSDAAACVATWNGGGGAGAPRARGMQLWVTESSSSYSTDLPAPAQNSFLHGMFTVAELGQYARSGVGTVARWAFSEGSPFALLALNATRGAWDAAADYFVLHAYLKTVGSGVLAVAGAEASDAVLVFAHCSAAPAAGNGSVTVFAVNVSEDPQDLAVAGVAATAPRVEFVLTAPGGNLSSFTPMLNGGGAPLRLNDDGSLPPFPGAFVAEGGAALLTLPPRSQGFFVLLGAGAPACM
jgi:hypothetical protein